jgi:hypothetical protein
MSESTTQSAVRMVPCKHWVDIGVAALMKARSLRDPLLSSRSQASLYIAVELALSVTVDSHHNIP